MTSICTLLSFNGEDFNPDSGEYTSKAGDRFWRMTTARRELAQLSRTGNFPSGVGVTLASRATTIVHEILGDRGVGGAHEDNLNLLTGRFYGYDGEEGTLVFTDSDGINKRITAMPIQLTPYENVIYGGALGEWLILDSLALSDDVEVKAAEAKTSSPATLTVANAGNHASPVATLTFKPTAQKTAANGQRYRFQITPLIRTKSPLVGWPVDITGGGWDHLTETGAGRSMTNGNDIEVYANGERLMHWYGEPSATYGVNKSTTQIWVNLDHPGARKWTVKAAISDSDTEVQMVEPLDALPQFPFFGIFTDGTDEEVVLITGYDRESRTFTLGERGSRGSTAAAWAAADELYEAPVLIDLVYGWTSAPTPDWINDDYKPMFLENTASQSTNGIFIYSDYQETRDADSTQSRKPRSASWITVDLGKHEREKLTGDGDMYWRWIPRTAGLSSDAAIASVMAIVYRSLGAYGGHPIMDRWILRCPIGFSEVKYSFSATTISIAGREARLEFRVIDDDGVTMIVAQHDNTSGSGATETFTGSLGRVAMFCIAPFDPLTDGFALLTPAQPNDGDGFTVDTVQITFDESERVRIVADLETTGRQNIYQFGRPDAPASITNSLGETLYSYGATVAINQTVSIDIETEAVSVEGVAVRSRQVQGTFPRIPKGVTDMTYTEAGLSDGATVEIGISEYRNAWA